MVVLVGDWTFLGASVALRQDVLLTPNVRDRAGVAWHNYPILSDNFEVEYDIQVRGPGRSTQRQGFAFWYVSQNFSESVSESMFKAKAGIIPTLAKEHGVNLYGFKGQFSGHAVVLSNVVPELKEPAPRAYFLSNDGSRNVAANSYHMGKEKFVDFPFRNAGVVTLRVRYQPSSIKAEIKKKEQGQWTTVYDGAALVKSGGFVGFSADSGPIDDVEGEADRVSLLKMTTRHFGAGSGESVPEYHPQAQGKAAGDFIHQHSLHAEHNEESHAIQELTHMVFKLVSETEPLRNQLKQAVETLGTRISKLEEHFEAVKSEISNRSGHQLDAEFNAMKRELNSLSRYATTEHTARQRKMESLEQDLSQVKTKGTGAEHDTIKDQLKLFKDRNEKLQERLKTSSSRNFWLAVLAIGFLVAAGGGVIQKFRSLEKKHVL